MQRERTRHPGLRIAQLTSFLETEIHGEARSSRPACSKRHSREAYLPDLHAVAAVEISKSVATGSVS
jgi:hypothetical protein